MKGLRSILEKEQTLKPFFGYVEICASLKEFLSNATLV